MKRASLPFFEDGSVDSAIPPLKVLLNIMAYGNYEGKDISDPELRKMFDRDVVLNSDWYKERLKMKQDKDIAYFKEQMTYLEEFKANSENATLVEEMNIEERLEKVKANLKHVESKQYVKELVGTIGVDPLHR
jgi:hypothetical protein